MRRLTLITAIALLGLAACSSDSSSDGTTAPTAAPDTTTAPTAAPDTTAPDTTAVGSDTTVDGSDDTLPGGGDGAGSEFCDINDELNDAELPLDGTSTPEEIEEYFTTFFPDALSRLTDVTPPELEADVTTLVEGVELFGSVLEESDWDVDTAFADPRLTDILTSEEFNTAGERVNTYCGV